MLSDVPSVECKQGSLGAGGLATGVHWPRCG